MNLKKGDIVMVAKHFAIDDVHKHFLFYNNCYKVLNIHNEYAQLHKNEQSDVSLVSLELTSPVQIAKSRINQENVRKITNKE